MKRKGNLYPDIYDINNLTLAAQKAMKGKSEQPGVIEFNKDPDQYLWELQQMMMNKTYRTSAYTTFIIREPKERLIFRLPFFPDRVAHHAAMNILEKIFVACFTADTYSCIKGRGIIAALGKLRKALLNKETTTLCLKLDIRKFYPTIDHQILKDLLRRKIKDQDLLNFLDEIIDSASGLPIGNYLSQYLANFYLTYFDHWIKEQKGVKNYFRYADDIVILAPDKQYLHKLLSDIRNYLSENLKLEVKSNYQVFPVAARGIDFVGYVSYHTHTRLRKSIKKNCARKMRYAPNLQSMAAYNGWLKHGNCINLKRKLFQMTNFKDLNIKPTTSALIGDRIEMMDLLGIQVQVKDYSIVPSKYQDRGNGKCLRLELKVNDKDRLLFTGSGVLMELVEKIPKDRFPVTTTIVKKNRRFEFT